MGMFCGLAQTRKKTPDSHALMAKGKYENWSKSAQEY